MRKEKNLLNKNFFTENLFVALINIHEMLESISSFTGDSRLMKAPLICLTETVLLSTIVVNGIPST